MALPDKVFSDIIFSVTTGVFFQTVILAKRQNQLQYPDFMAEIISKLGRGEISLPCPTKTVNVKKQQNSKQWQKLMGDTRDKFSTNCSFVLTLVIHGGRRGGGEDREKEIEKKGGGEIRRKQSREK